MIILVLSLLFITLNISPSRKTDAALFKEAMTSILCCKSKDETVTFPAHRLLWSDRLAYANKIKINAMNTTCDAEGVNIRIKKLKPIVRGF
jgi:hypothetical protein